MGDASYMLVLDVRELKDSAGKPILSKVMVNDKIGLEFNPGFVVVIMGRSGSGKTLLAWILYYAPMVLANYFFRIIEARDLASVMAALMDAISEYSGSTLIRWWLEKSQLHVCRPGEEVAEIEDVGYSAANVSRVCVGLKSGELAIRVETVDGRLYYMKVNDIKKAKVVERVLIQAALAYSLPSQFKWSSYALTLEKIDKLCGVASAIVELLEKVQEPRHQLLKLLAATRLPPLEFRAEDQQAEEKVKCTMLHEDLVEATFTPVTVHVSSWGERIEVSLLLPHGELNRVLVEASLNISQALAEEVASADSHVYPVVFIDDAFEGLTLRDAYKSVAEPMLIAARAGVSVVATTHRPEVLVYQEDEVSELSKLAKPLIATYGLSIVSREFKVRKDFRLKLVDYSRLSEEAEKEVHEVFLGGIRE